MAELLERTARIDMRLDELATVTQQDRETHVLERQHLLRILRFIQADEHRYRERLVRVRQSEEYERAYTDPDPLISVLIPTFDNYRVMVERTIPSVLAQTYTNWEIVIVGDNAPPEAADAADSFGDERIRYWNLPIRGRYPDVPMMRWLVAGSTPANEAFANARGQWLAPMADDDAMRPNHMEVLLEVARRDRLEVAYAKSIRHGPNGEQDVNGAWPPQLGEFSWQSSLHHGALRFFELQLSDAEFDLPIDWAKAERMLRLGVRFGWVDEVVVDLWPSRLWHPRDVPPEA